MLCVNDNMSDECQNILKCHSECDFENAIAKYDTLIVGKTFDTHVIGRLQYK